MNDSIKLLAVPWTHFLVFMMWADKSIWHVALNYIPV